MTAQERYDTWIRYKNACELCVTYDARTNKKLGRKRNQKADELYQVVRFFHAEDICEPKPAKGDGEQ